MSDLQIIGAPQSNFVWTTRIVLTEKGVDYALAEARPHTPEVDAIHPFGKIPVMRHGGFTLCESRAICAYVDRVFDGPSLMPSEPRRAAQTEQWISLFTTTIDPGSIRPYLGAYFFPGTPDGSPDRPRIEQSLPHLERHLAVLDGAVASGHLAGDAFTLADAYVIPMLYYLGKMPESSAMMASGKALGAYVARHVARRSVRDTVPPPMPGQQAKAAAA
jgi:glutathione S-transferase